jgi:hypothetical protein
MMPKKFRLLFLFFYVALSAVAQTDSVSQNLNADTVYKKILLIPYNPMMHLSDADNDISEYSGITENQLRSMFRAGLSQQVYEALVGNYSAYSLLSENSKERKEELEMIYGSLNYRMDTVYSVLHPPKTGSQKQKSLFSKNPSAKTKEVHDLKYMNIGLSHPELLAKLSEKYGTELFVFLNQFEMDTHYDDCLDLALKIYRRDIKVHYSVFDATGKQVYGDVAVVHFPSNTNDIREIMAGNFLKISDNIVSSLHSLKK